MWKEQVKALFVLEFFLSSVFCAIILWSNTTIIMRGCVLALMAVVDIERNAQNLSLFPPDDDNYDAGILYPMISLGWCLWYTYVTIIGTLMTMSCCMSVNVWLWPFHPHLYLFRLSAHARWSHCFDKHQHNILNCLFRGYISMISKINFELIEKIDTRFRRFNAMWLCSTNQHFSR